MGPQPKNLASLQLARFFPFAQFHVRCEFPSRFPQNAQVQLIYALYSDTFKRVGGFPAFFIAADVTISNCAYLPEDLQNCSGKDTIESGLLPLHFAIAIEPFLTVLRNKRLAPLKWNCSL